MIVLIVFIVVFYCCFYCGLMVLLVNDESGKLKITRRVYVKLQC